MIIISAMSSDRVIGSGEGMPWNVPSEYQRFIDKVYSNTIILGRRSWEIFGKDLPDGHYIVITRRTEIAGAIAASSLEQALEFAAERDNEVFVAGGESIYKLAIPLADEMYLSTIKGDFQGDAYFPEFDMSDWEVVFEKEYPDYIHRRFVRRA